MDFVYPEELELMDHVFACHLNTAHYDEKMIDICWEWIDSFEREPRTREHRVIANSQLAIYYAYHQVRLRLSKGWGMA